MHIHYQEEKCYDEEIFFYHLGCHQWVSTGERWSLSEFLWTVSSVTNTIHSFHLQLVVVTYASIPTALKKVFCFFLGGDAVRGRYSHVATVMEGQVLLVAGGYSGVARGDLMAYKVPLFVSSDQGDRVSENAIKQKEKSDMSLERLKNK